MNYLDIILLGKIFKDMKKKEINNILKDKKIKKLVKEIKHHNKVINEQKKQFNKLIEKAQKNRAKLLKQLKQVER